MELAPARLIWAARVCYLEGTFRLDDCGAILHVARKRAQRVGTSWLHALRAYSVLEQVDNPRTREVRALPWGDVEGQDERWNDRWQQLRELVADFDRGEIPDPCPRATDWGGVMDPPRGRMVPARCARGFKSANTFYALRGAP